MNILAQPLSYPFEASNHEHIIYLEHWRISLSRWITNPTRSDYFFFIILAFKDVTREDEASSDSFSLETFRKRELKKHIRSETRNIERRMNISCKKRKRKVFFASLDKRLSVPQATPLEKASDILTRSRRVDSISRKGLHNKNSLNLHDRQSFELKLKINCQLSSKIETWVHTKHSFT